MKKTLNAFSSVFNISRIASGAFVLALACATPCMVYAATGNGCEEEGVNEYITPTLALCSTHVYNIGQTANPAEEANKQAMRDVVALKTTVITQQMYAQYEYLDAMLRRFKTQLKKAVLTTSLQAAGATDADGNGGTSGGGSSGGGGYYNANQNIVLTGANDCMAQGDKSSAISCLQNNLSLIRNAVASSNIGDAYRQLVKDVKAAETWGAVKLAEIPECNKDNTDPNKKLKSTKKSVEACIPVFNVKLANAKSDVSKPNFNPWGQMMGPMGGKQ